MDAVLITAHMRPEFLWLCLEHILKNPDYNENHYIINLDKGYRRDNIRVFQKFRKHFNSIETNLINNPIKSIGKQSYAVLEGYRYAQSKASNLVYMIEEDVMVSNVFFKWHKLIHEQEPDIYCSIATRNNNTRVEPLGDYNRYYLHKGDYQSLGVCFQKDKLNLVLQHANGSYYNDPFNYCAKKWPNSGIGRQFVEQDGLHRRVLIEHALNVAFSYDGFAFHAGYYGYHRKNRETGSIDQKIAKIRGVAFNKEALKKRTLNNGDPIEFYLDSEPVNLNITLEGALIRD